MARIQEYNLQTTPTGPERQVHASENDTGGIGQAMQQFGASLQESAGVIERAQGQAEVADLSSQLSKLHMDSTVGLNSKLQQATPEDIVAGTPIGAPGSVGISQKFMEDFDSKLASISEKASTKAGREYITKSGEALKAHFYESSARGQAELVGAKAVSDTKLTMQQSSAALMSDPTAFEISRKNFSEYVKSMVATGGLPAEKAIELQRMGDANLAEGAARGWMSINPELAKKQIENGQWDSYFGADQKKQLMGEAEMHINAKETEAHRMKKLEKDAIEQRIDTTQTDMLNKIYGGNLSTRDILNSPDLDYKAKKEMLGALQKHTTESLKTDPEVMKNLWDDIHAPEGSPHKIKNVNDLNKYVGAGISIPDLQKLRAEMLGSKTPEGQIEAQLKKGFTDIAKSQLTKSNPLTGMRDPLGDQQYQAFLSEFIPAYEKQKAAGKSPRDLLNPSSPEYMGKIINTYVKTPQQLQQEMADQMRRSTPQAGEKWVDVVAPDGRVGRMLESKFEAASKAGYTRK